MTDPPIVLPNPIEELLHQSANSPNFAGQNYHAVPVCDLLPKGPHLQVGDTCFVSSCGRIFHFTSDRLWRYVIFKGGPGTMPSFLLPVDCKDQCLIRRLAMC